MSVMLDYAPDDIALIQEQAKASNTSVEEFIRQASLKAARNAAYLAELDRSREEFQQGKVVAFTDEEWEKYIVGAQTERTGWCTVFLAIR